MGSTRSPFYTRGRTRCCGIEPDVHLRACSVFNIQYLLHLLVTSLSRALGRTPVDATTDLPNRPFDRWITTNDRRACLMMREAMIDATRFWGLDIVNESFWKYSRAYLQWPRATYWNVDFEQKRDSFEASGAACAVVSAASWKPRICRK